MREKKGLVTIQSTQKNKKILDKLEKLKVITVMSKTRNQCMITLCPSVTAVVKSNEPESLDRRDIYKIWKAVEELTQLIVLITTVRGVLTLQEAVTHRVGGRIIGYVRK